RRPRGSARGRRWARRAPRSFGELEEGRLPLALQADVEAVAVLALFAGDEGLSQPLVRYRAEHGVSGVRLRLVFEVDAGYELLQEPPGEDRDHDVRRLGRPFGAGNGAWLEGDEREAPLLHGARAAEAVEALLQ